MGNMPATKPRTRSQSRSVTASRSSKRQELARIFGEVKVEWRTVAGASCRIENGHIVQAMRAFPHPVNPGFERDEIYRWRAGEPE